MTVGEPCFRRLRRGVQVRPFHFVHFTHSVLCGGARIQDRRGTQQVIGTDPEPHPAGRAIDAPVTGSAQAMSSFEHTDPALAPDTPSLLPTKPPLSLVRATRRSLPPPRGNPEALVFSTRRGKPISPNNVLTLFVMDAGQGTHRAHVAVRRTRPGARRRSYPHDRRDAGSRHPLNHRPDAGTRPTCAGRGRARAHAARHAARRQVAVTSPAETTSDRARGEFVAPAVYGGAPQ